MGRRAAGGVSVRAALRLTPVPAEGKNPHEAIEESLGRDLVCELDPSVAASHAAAPL